MTKLWARDYYENHSSGNSKRKVLWHPNSTDADKALQAVRNVDKNKYTVNVWRLYLEDGVFKSKLLEASTKPNTLEASQYFLQSFIDYYGPIEATNLPDNQKFMYEMIGPGNTVISSKGI